MTFRFSRNAPHPNRQSTRFMKHWYQFIALFLALASVTAAADKKILLIAGKQSHGPGDHEFRAGCLLLKQCLDQVPGIVSEVHSNGWPADLTAFDGADAVLIYADGGGGHPAIQADRMKFIDALADRGVGIGCAHYGVEVPKGDPGAALQKWIGGYYEHLYSCNPMWSPEFKSFPEHPITRGVQPFSVRDEWYFNMRFRPDMENVTPILVAPPSDDVRDGPYVHPQGPYPHILANQGRDETMMWAVEREDGGRGFGFTGGHHHVNWGNDDFRKVVLNALLWIAKAEVPANGVQSTVNPEQLEENLDPKQPRRRAAQSNPAPTAAKPAWQSKVVSQGTVAVDVDIRGANKIWLTVGDGGDGFGCDWADWAEPTLIKSDGGKVKLTDLKWTRADAGWGSVRVNQNAGGGSLKIAGQPVSFGIGTHAPSLIEYDLSGQTFVKFQAQAGPDNGGTDQGCGSTVQFSVLTDKPSPKFVAALASQGGGSGNQRGSDRGHGWEAALEDLESMEVAAGLEVTLFAAEPQLVNPANMDIDARGRVWITEGANYRRWSNPPLRPEGDRIVILEDTNGDGRADASKTFYQGTDINSALGLCVLGDKVIVSCSPKVMMFTDANGDDRADGPPQILFNGIGGVQHDHGAHAFVFGPDGKLYFNVGNDGRQLKTPDGEKFIVDEAGLEVRQHLKPYQQGLVFRCNPDGSHVETLAWNFRNNYEVSVDSFGTLWQSDNDDDGNRSVRINYVMEYGNFGFRDELTGAGWGDAWKKANEGKNLSDSEKPNYHWHLDDPGVVPTMLVTGQGSPTGICVYEGQLLPKPFHNQILHCDAGPRVVRAYPVQKDGAGYKASTLDLLTSSDSWFRPSDVCVAPDGSVYVADWFDPGVGGHNMGDRELTTMRGRVYRIAPRGHRPSVPKLDLAGAAGCVEALQSPNMATRYLAWTKLHAMQDKAESALLELWKSDEPRLRARALHLLARIDGKASQYVGAAIDDANPDIRITGLRIARALDLDIIPIVSKLVRDPSAQVRRECAIALRHHPSAKAPGLWAVLARQHDGQDRWYLEALGIGADQQEDKFFQAWLAAMDGQWNTASGRDILWRIRSTDAPPFLVKLITDETIPAEERQRYLRSLDFIDGPKKEAALVEILTSGL